MRLYKNSRTPCFKRPAFVKACFLISVFVYNLNGYCQKPGDSLIRDRKEILFSRNHFGVSFITSLAQKAAVSPLDKYQTGSSPQLSFEGGIDRYLNFSRNFSMSFGLHGGVIRRNFEYFINKDDFNPPTEGDISNYGAPSRENDLVYLRIPLTAIKRFSSVNSKYWSVFAGASLLFSLNNDIEGYHYILYPNGVRKMFLTEMINSNNDGKPWLNYHMGSGHSWILSNNNFLNASILANLSFTKFANGSYEFLFDPQANEKGTYSVNGSFIGFGVSYVFTKKLL